MEATFRQSNGRVPSGTSEFLTPLVGFQFAKPFRQRIATSLHVVLGWPRPPNDFTTRLAGPGFDLTTESTGAVPAEIGDAFGVVSLVIRDRKTGFGIDIGSTLTFPIFEALNHQGVRRTFLLSISWRQP